MLLKILKIIGKTILGILAFVVIYFLAAVVLSLISTPTEPANGSDVAIYILTNGDHTDIVAPIRNNVIDWSTEIKFQDTKSNDTTARYVAFGWGDKGFFLNTPTWAQLKFSTAFNAVFGLSTPAMHTSFYRAIHEGPNCKRIMLSSSQYGRLVTYITRSFRTNASGQFENIKASPYDINDAFYEANYTYSLFYTCNTWTNNALKACGQKACLWTPFDKGIFYQYKH